MKIKAGLFMIVPLFFLLGCQTAQQAAKEGGVYIGKGTKAIGGVSEGALEGYKDKGEENPYTR